MREATRDSAPTHSCGRFKARRIANRAQSSLRDWRYWNSNENGKPPPPAFKSDKEALELWDTIVDSIRVRPTSSSPRDGNAGPSLLRNPLRLAAKRSVMTMSHEEFLSSLKPKDSWLDDL